jgi:hypothetical protein
MLDTDHPLQPHPHRGPRLPAPAPDLVTVPARQGLEAADILRLGAGVGPVIHHDQGDSLGFLVPPGTAAGWDLPGSACTQTGGWSAAGIVPGEWLMTPHTSAPVTDPVVLRAALGQAARTIELADRL